VTRVLLIEDHDAARRGWAEFLDAQGLDVIQAADGAAGLAAAVAERPHVIVLDIGLPDIDGLSVARRLQSDSATARVPIIALTGSDLPDERANALAAGCIRHLAKPCAPGTLLDAIRLAAEAP
jgi:two-component system cell cycle response regulator DivK